MTMSHPDGMTALMSGSVACQLTTAPYIFKAKEQDNIKEAESLDSVWPEGNAFIVGLVSDDLYKISQKLTGSCGCNAGSDGLHQQQPGRSSKYSLQERGCHGRNDAGMLQDPGCVYDMKLPGVMDMQTLWRRMISWTVHRNPLKQSQQSRQDKICRKRKNKDENDEKFKKSDCFYCCCSGGMAGRLSDGFLSGTDVSVTWKDISVADQRIFAGRAGSDDALFLKPDRKKGC